MSIFISVIVFVYSWHVNTDQNKKWEQINLGKINIKNVRFTYFREIDANQFDTINWGYPIKVITDPESKIMQTGKYLVQNCLVAVDNRSHKVYGDESSITIEELKKELVNPNVIQDTLYLQLEKKYYVDIELENVGETHCFIPKENIFLKDPSPPHVYHPIPVSDSGTATLESKKNNHTRFALSFFAMLDLPNPLEFKFEVFYKDVNEKEHTQAFHLVYSKATWEVYGDK